MSSSREASFRRRVVDCYQGLPPQQQLVADYVLAHLKEVPLVSVPELAHGSGASEATVVRFAQRLGFGGFAALKRELAELVREEVRPPRAEARALQKAPEGDTLTAVARQEMSNIQRSVDEADRDVVAAIADGLFEATHVYFWGRGISSHLAGLGAYLLAQLGRPASVVSPALSSPLEALAMMRPSDALFAFSFPPYSDDTIALVREANARGLIVVGVSDRETAPLAAACRWALSIRSENMMFTNSFAAVSTLLNGLCTEIAVRHPDACADAVATITATLEG